MQYPEIIKNSLSYIEQNLKTDIKADELARKVNYSIYHFYRLFSSVMGSSVAGYILRRRLDHALAEIACGRKAIDVVLEYGFDTYAGFYKAFVKMYGCSPKKYLSIYNEHKLTKSEVAIIYTEKELREILDYWEIEKNLPIYDICVMDENNWEVGNKYILKTGNREKLLKDIKVSKELQALGFNSSLPIITKTGSEYPDGKEMLILTKKLKGKPLPVSDRFGENRTEFGEKYGKSIARLHKALKAVQKDFALDEVNVYKNTAEWALPNVKLQNIQWSMGIDESFFNDYIESFGNLYEKLPKQLIHRDPNPGHILFEDGAVSGFTDFNLCEINIRLWDVCYCATGILSESGSEEYEKWLDILTGALHGYDSEVKLNPEEKQAVFYVICSIQMICIAYFESRDEFRKLAGINRSMLQFIILNRSYIDSIFQ